jgi:hypothetical protein
MSLWSWRTGALGLAIILFACVVITLRIRSDADGHAQHAAISLRVNSARRIEIIAGTPLIFDVSLTSRTAGSSISIGGGDRPWATLVRLVRAGSRESIPWPALALGTPLTVQIETARGVAPDIRVVRSDIARIEPGRTNQVALAAAPEATTSVQPGAYEIQAEIEQGYWPPWRWHGRLTSTSVTVVVRAAGPRGPEEMLERARLALSARYYLAAKRPADAHRAALELVGHDPKSPGAAMLLGDALAALGKNRDAIDVYRVALANSPGAYEPPELLYQRIERLSRMGTK